MGQMQWMRTALKSPAMPQETTWQRQKKTWVNHENSIAHTTQENADHNAKEPFKNYMESQHSLHKRTMNLRMPKDTKA